MTLPGASKGLLFIFQPDFSAFTLSSVSAALGQVFYSLSLCMGITITYGSYLSGKENIPKKLYDRRWSGHRDCGSRGYRDLSGQYLPSVWSRDRDRD